MEKKSIKHDVEYLADNRIAVVNTIDKTTQNEYVTTITKTENKKFNYLVVNKYNDSAYIDEPDTSIDEEKRNITIEELVTEMKEANKDALLSFREDDDQSDNTQKDIYTRINECETEEQAIELMKEVNDEFDLDIETRHHCLDRILLNLINNDEITKQFDLKGKFYA